MEVLIFTDKYLVIAMAGANLMRGLALKFWDHGHKIFLVTTVESDTRPKKRL